MAVKLELYRVFQEVARMGNISAAAQNLYISQSAVSQSIKQLEEQLQVRLFSRSTRGVVLTSEGKMLLDYVSHGLGLIQCGEEKLAQSRQLHADRRLRQVEALRRAGDVIFAEQNVQRAQQIEIQPLEINHHYTCH